MESKSIRVDRVHPRLTMSMVHDDAMPMHTSSEPTTLSPYEQPVGSARAAFAAHKDEIDRLDLAWAQFQKAHLSAVIGYLIDESVVSQAKSWRIDHSVKSGSRLQALLDEIDEAMPVEGESKKISQKLTKLFKSQLVQFGRFLESGYDNRLADICQRFDCLGLDESDREKEDAALSK